MSTKVSIGMANVTRAVSSSTVALIATLSLLFVLGNANRTANRQV
jgi:hypothetical protein